MTSKHRPHRSDQSAVDHWDGRLTPLEQALEQCMRRDVFPLRQRIRRLRGRPADDAGLAELERISERLQQSQAIRDARASRVPPLDYPEDLPVSGKRDEIRAALLANQVIIVCGETGSGKTTQLPKICLEAGRGLTGFIGHTQPRRIAARSVANRIAEELKRPMGEAVGFKVRFQDHTRPDSLIKLMTDGILLAESQTDRFLDQYDTLIVDEAHERSLNIDFLLGYLRWLLPRRPDFKLIITSATIDPQRFSRHFGNAPIIEVSGRTYPVEVRYRPVAIDETDETEGAEQQAIATAVAELWREQPGDILVFLSGEREIRETAESLRKQHPKDCEILPLYSRLSAGDQERIFKPSGGRRIVLSTNVAETSLTVPGIRAVIDTGFARISRYSYRSKLQRLPIEKISQASAAQRAGRCGRVGPGVCIRLYAEDDFARRAEFTDPEILRTNLAAVILQMKALKLGEIEAFPFVEPPDERMVRDGLKTLQEINALDEQRNLTEIGQRLARMPVDPRLGRILLAAVEGQCLTEICIIVAALSVPDPRERPADQLQQADQKHARFKHEHSDFLGFLNLWNEVEAQRKHLSKSKLRQWARDNFLSYLRLSEWHDIHGQILEVVKGEFALKLNQVPGGYPEIHKALLTGLITNVGFKQDQVDYVGTRGGKHYIHPASSQFKPKPKWIMAAEQVETTKVYARIVAKIEPEWIEMVGAHLLKQHHFDPHWERKPARAAVHERTTLYSLTIQSGRKIPLERIDPAAARELFIRSALVLMDYDSKAEFFLHNLKLLEEAEYLQQKGRRADLLVDDQWLYRFFDERIPAEVVNGITFERWRKRAEVAKPGLLKLSREDITRKEDERLDAHNFPDAMSVAGVKIPLQYRFEPGHEDDGVTAVVPLHLLNRLEQEPFAWLVPGLLKEKLTALIKSLPKTYRIHFVPVPDFAERALPMLDFGRGSLFAQLSDALRKCGGGFNVPVNAFQEDSLPTHLRMNFALVDEFNTVVDRSRSLAELKTRRQTEARQNFTQLARQTYLKTGCKTWDFGELPDSFDGQYDGQPVHGYAGAFDEGETVGVRIFDTQDEARRQHRRGLTRLLRLTLAKELKYVKKSLSLNPNAELGYRRLPAHPFLYPELKGERELRNDLVDSLVAGLYLDGQRDIRDADAFERRIETHRTALAGRADELARAAQVILQSYAELQAGLKKNPKHPAGADLTEQLSLLIYAGFWLPTPYAQIKEIPRYLKAALLRLEKAPQDPGRDQRQLAELLPLSKRYWAAIRAANGNRLPEEDLFRWQLEEFRVSLFAQTLKTAYPVSAKRLEEAWKQSVAGSR